MKLTNNIKKKIDRYFDNIRAEDLFLIAKTKYGFTENNIELENQGFDTIKKCYYNSTYSSFNIIEDADCNLFPFAA